MFKTSFGGRLGLTPEVLSKRFFGRDEEYKEGGEEKIKEKGSLHS